MKRSGFKCKAPPRREATQMTYSPRPRAVAVAMVDTRDKMVVPVPKGVKAKPGKTAPTADERKWLDAIVAYGCIACRMDGRGVVPPAVHHILRGGRRMGHLFSLPLCDPGHHQNGESKGMTSRHPWKARFEKRYGSELELLAVLSVEVASVKEACDGLV